MDESFMVEVVVAHVAGSAMRVCHNHNLPHTQLVNHTHNTYHAHSKVISLVFR